MRDNARDRPSRNACDDTFSTIGKGPRKRWMSFFEGRVVWIFRESSQTVSPNLEWGDREALRCRVDHILFEGTRYLVTKVQMELLEVCRNLMSSIQHHRFEGYFEFRMEAFVGEEWGDRGRRVRSVVVHELGKRKEVDPIVLLVVDVHPKILFQDLVDLFGLAIRLRVIGG